MSQEITKSGLRHLRNEINKILDEENGEAWPYDEYCVPPKNTDVDENTLRTSYNDPAEYDAMFYMPPEEHDFSCHECDGTYGPWVHDGFSINVDGGYHSKPIYANILHKRKRWCRDCGYEFFSCYAVGKVHFSRNDSGTVSFDSFK